MHETAQTYFGPNMTVLEPHQLVKGGKGVDPLREFSMAAHAEPRSFAPL